MKSENYHELSPSEVRGGRLLTGHESVRLEVCFPTEWASVKKNQRTERKNQPKVAFALARRALRMPRMSRRFSIFMFLIISFI